MGWFYSSSVIQVVLIAPSLINQADPVLCSPSIFPELQNLQPDAEKNWVSIYNATFWLKKERGSGEAIKVEAIFFLPQTYTL